MGIVLILCELDGLPQVFGKRLAQRGSGRLKTADVKSGTEVPLFACIR
jgi:hypothetical protein